MRATALLRFQTRSSQLRSRTVYHGLRPLIGTSDTPRSLVVSTSFKIRPPSTVSTLIHSAQRPNRLGFGAYSHRLLSIGVDSPSQYDLELLELLEKDDFKGILKLLKSLYEHKKRLQAKTFHTILRVCAQLECYEAAEAGEEILQWMMEFNRERMLDREPSRANFAWAVKAWANAKHPQSGDRAEKLLHRIGEHFAPLDRNMYTIAMSAYAKLGNVLGTQRLVEQIIEEYSNGNDTLMPDPHCYATLMEAHVRSGDEGAGEEAANILALMKEEWKEGHLKDPLNRICYNTAINAHAKCGDAKQAENMFDLMYDDYRAGNKSATPDVKSFSTVLDAWARSGNEGAGERAEKILNLMIKLSDDYKLHVRPDVVCYGAAINAYGQAGRARDAERMLGRQYRDFKHDKNKAARPNRICFLAVINGWSKSNEESAAKRAEGILDHMEKMHAARTLLEPPHTYIYGAVMNCWAESGNWEKAEMILKRMKQDFRRGNKEAKPDVTILRTLLKAYLVGKAENAGEKADEVLGHLQKFNTAPDKEVYELALGCWEQSIDHPMARKRCSELTASIQETPSEWRREKKRN